MTYVKEERIVCKCDVCGETMLRIGLDWKFFRLLSKSTRFLYLNIKKRKTFFWKFRFLWFLLWDEKEIDICEFCQNSIKETLTYLSNKNCYETYKKQIEKMDI